MDSLDYALFLILAVLIIWYFIPSKPKQKSEAEIEEINKQGGDISEGEKIVSFLIPLVGFIIYGVNSSERPDKANKALKAAIWGMAFGVILYIVARLLLLRH
jgi:phage shock protein PspC (stress-responsive transcriptional regulator)